MIALLWLGLALPTFAVELTEAERCERSLSAAIESDFANRRDAIAANDHHVEQALRLMKETGDLASEARISGLRGELKLGQIFAREGLVHEAIYQTFTHRFATWRRAREALANFRHLSHASDRAILIAEVIERTLQFVPEVDLDNVDRLGARATFLNLAPAQLRDFRDRWIVYDEDDGFADLIQGAVLSILNSGNPQLVRDVEARGSLLRRYFGQSRAVALPVRPAPVDASLTVRQIAFGNEAYYGTGELLEYLEASSVAARQYFVMSGLAYLNQDQLKLIAARAGEWRLKPSLRSALARALNQRQPWLEKTKTLAELRALDREIHQALVRFDLNERYDARAVQAAIGRVWRAQDPTEVTNLAAEVLDHVGRDGTPAQFVGAVVSVRDASLSRVGGRHEPTRRLIGTTVARANEMGLDEAQFRKVESVIRDWAERVPSVHRPALRRATELLVMRQTTLPKMNPPALHRRRAEVDQLVNQLAAELDEAARMLLNSR